MIRTTDSLIIEQIAESIDIPDSAYEKAETRYKDLADWFGRKEAHCNKFEPHIYPQGSFRLGTVVRPVHPDGEYDLDMGCRLKVGIAKATHSQKQLKELVGADLEEYRTARGIKEALEAKHRCWRLQYADVLKFHLDAVPSIPETAARRRQLQDILTLGGLPADLAALITQTTNAITDDRHWNYSIINEDWRLSNSEGFAHWFQSRMKLAKVLLQNRALEARAAQVDDLPAYRWKSPLQRCVQLLKRHRDIKFEKDPEGQPASIIITTLAARAYQGEADIGEALNRILSTMGSLVNRTSPRVPNPVNPAEDFADRWNNPASSKLKLEEKFWGWLHDAQIDFGAVEKERNATLIMNTARAKFGAALDPVELQAKLELNPTGGLLRAAVTPAALSFPDKPLVPTKPAGFA
jgi:hypothetical protein